MVTLVSEVRPAIVVNCAGATTGSREQLLRANVQVVANLLAALRVGGGPGRLIHIGSAAEYGPTPPGTAVSESWPPHPASDYGDTKLTATRSVLEADWLPVRTVLRVFNPVGANAPRSTVVGAAVRAMHVAMAEGRDEVQLGALDAYRDFLHVDDVADAIVAAVTRRVLPPVINVGSGTATQLRTALAMLARLAGYDGLIVESARSSTRSAEVPWQQADIGLARSALSWTPARTLEQALEAAWRSGSEGAP